MVRTVALAHDSLCTAPVPMHPATIAVLHSQPLADSTPTLRSPSDYFSDTLLGAFVAAHPAARARRPPQTEWKLLATLPETQPRTQDRPLGWHLLEISARSP